MSASSSSSSSSGSSSASSSDASSIAGHGKVRKAEEDTGDKLAKRLKLEKPEGFSALREIFTSLCNSPIVIPGSKDVLSDAYSTSSKLFFEALEECLRLGLLIPQVLYSLVNYSGCFREVDPMGRLGGNVLEWIMRVKGIDAPFLELFCRTGAYRLEEEKDRICPAQWMTMVAGFYSTERLRATRLVFEFGRDFTFLSEAAWFVLSKRIVEGCGCDAMFWINCLIQCGGMNNAVKSNLPVHSHNFKAEYNIYQMALSKRRTLINDQLSLVKEFADELKKIVIEYVGEVILMHDGQKFTVVTINVSGKYDPFNPVFEYESKILPPRQNA
jgi:hypothetical protein